MKYVDMSMEDTFTKQKIRLKQTDIPEGWDEQVELFFQFLVAQGYVITYASFINTFGNIVKDNTEAYSNSD